MIRRTLGMTQNRAPSDSWSDSSDSSRVVYVSFSMLTSTDSWERNTSTIAKSTVRTFRVICPISLYAIPTRFIGLATDTYQPTTAFELSLWQLGFPKSRAMLALTRNH